MKNLKIEIAVIRRHGLIYDIAQGTLEKKGLLAVQEEQRR
jgi:hypothetical protein